MKGSVIFENSVSTSQRRRCTSITKSSPWIWFREVIAIYCPENLTNCAAQTAFRKANTSLATRDISYTVCNLPALCSFHGTPPLAPTLSQIIPIYGHSISLLCILTLHYIYALVFQAASFLHVWSPEPGWCLCSSQKFHVIRRGPQAMSLLNTGNLRASYLNEAHVGTSEHRPRPLTSTHHTTYQSMEILSLTASGTRL
jgi:hypothetical protein